MKGQGRYRIHAVAEITGVPEATLRAWERRYSTPTPLRTPSGYRLYSHKDVEQVRKMRELCAAGMSPAEAAKLVGGSEEAPEPEELSTDPFQTAAERIVEATKRMDPAAVESEVRLATTFGDAASVVERVFCPAMAEVGREWSRGHLSVGHEHMVAEIITATTRDLLRLAGPPRPVGEVLLACFADEEHVLPLYAAAFRFIEWGFRPHLLGARTPPNGLGAAVRELEPACVGLSVTISPTPERAQELLSAYAQAVGDTPWAVGGSAAPALKEMIEAAGALLIDRDDPDAREALGRLLTKVKR